MGLNIKRTVDGSKPPKNSERSISISSSLMSGRYAFQAPLASTPPEDPSIITETVTVDGDGQVSTAAMKALFDKLWELAEQEQKKDLCLCMSQVCAVPEEFADQLKSLRRHLSFQNRKITLWRVRPECAHLVRCH